MTDEERWAEKTDFAPGVDLSVPAPEVRYQLLDGTAHVLQQFADGSVARGSIAPSMLGWPMPEEGWYDWDGTFLGDDPKLPQD